MRGTLLKQGSSCCLGKGETRPKGTPSGEVDAAALKNVGRNDIPTYALLFSFCSHFFSDADCLSGLLTQDSGLSSEQTEQTEQTV